MRSGKTKNKEDRRLWQAVEQTVRPFPLTTSQKKLLVGVSGGADSLALLHLLWQRLGNERLVVAHLNHGLRPEADAEATFVADTAAGWGIPCEVGIIDVAAAAKTFRLSLEAAGRLARYRFLAGKAKEVEAAAVVVGHQADDQAETVLLHLLRGSGSAGLRGMLPVSELPESEGLLLLRPFLNTTRAELEAYCARHGLSPRQDASNEDVQFTRNRIRHELLPLLQTYNTQIQANLQQLAIITADEYAALQARFDQIWPELLVARSEAGMVLDRGRYAGQAVAWQRLALRRAVQRLRPQVSDIGFQTIEAARTLILENKSGKEAFLPGGLLMQVTAREVIFGDAGAARLAAVPQLDLEAPVPLKIPGKIDLANGWTVAAAPAADVPLAEIQQNENPWRAFVALGDNDRLWLRPSLPGERFQPLGLGGHSQAIQALLSDRKVARGQRPLWPMVATAAHPVWIVGQHLDERARVTAKSLHVVQLSCHQHGG